MKNVLITGATGNIGLAVFKALEKIKHNFNLYAGVRDLDQSYSELSVQNIHFVKFDFIDISISEKAWFCK